MKKKKDMGQAKYFYLASLLRSRFFLRGSHSFAFGHSIGLFGTVVLFFIGSLRFDNTPFDLQTFKIVIINF